MQQKHLSNELIIQRWHNGVKLISLDEAKKAYHCDEEDLTHFSIANILKLNFCAYFLNSDSEVQTINEHGLVACNFDSTQQAFGKSMFDVATREVATRITGSHKEAMHSHKIKMVEEDVLRKDDFSFQCLSALLPWYNNENKIIGVLGCTILPGLHPLADSLTEISNIGLSTEVNSEHRLHSLIRGKLIEKNIYLSKREFECTSLLVHGRTSKQIAKVMNISHRTVEHYISNIKNKMGVSTKFELIGKLIELS